MALIAGGKYALESRKKDPVDVAPFCIDKRETTAGEYATCIAKGQCAKALLDACEGATAGFDDLKDHPIVCVDMSQATAYCTAQGKRLPTDVEWEWAARGGERGWKYPWGNDEPKEQLCWAGGKGGKRSGTCAVGSFPGGDSPDGLQDLAGNVLEWTTTPYDGKVPERGVRGGSWKDGTSAMIHVGRVGWFKPTYRCGFLGIRCVEAPAVAISSNGATPAPASSALSVK